MPNRSLAAATLMILVLAACSPATSEGQSHGGQPSAEAGRGVVTVPAAPETASGQASEDDGDRLLAEAGKLLESACDNPLKQDNGIALQLASKGAQKAVGRTSGPGNIEHGRTCIWRVGEVRGGARPYTAYLMEYAFGQALRAQYSILFLRDDRTYVGRYVIEGTDVRIEHGDLVLGSEYRGVHLQMGRAGPPSHLSPGAPETLEPPSALPRNL